MGAPRPVAAAGRWLYRYRLTIWVVAFTAATVLALAAGWMQYQRIERLTRAQDRSQAISDARDCLEAWDRSDGARTAIEKSISGVLALGIAVYSPAQLTPERRAQIDAAAGPIVEESQAEILDPTCNRERARERLRELGVEP